MRLSAGLALLILLTITGPIQAADIPSQPLTRSECDKAGLVWNDNSNVCGFGSEEAKASGSVESSSQPLTRAACDQVGMTWDEKGNVCGSSEESSLAAEAASETVAESLSQPLTRAACDISGMSWNETANVCGSEAMPSSGAASQAVVVEPPSQPLSRAACEQAGMAWNENANVCGSESPVASTWEATVTAETPGQPLTRAACDKANMPWNDRANVCGVASDKQRRRLRLWSLQKRPKRRQKLNGKLKLHSLAPRSIPTQRRGRTRIGGADNRRLSNLWSVVRSDCSAIRTEPATAPNSAAFKRWSKVRRSAHEKAPSARPNARVKQQHHGT
jgi:hypothetical protein